MIVGHTTYQDLVEYELLSAWKHLRYPTTVNASKSKVLKYMNRTDLLGRNVIKSKVLKYGFKPIFKPD